MWVLRSGSSIGPPWHCARPLPAVTLSEVLATSDVPGIVFMLNVSVPSWNSGRNADPDHARAPTAVIAIQARSWRLGAAVFTAFGVLSLIIAAIGVYGVLSFTVARRMPELGIRAALGATSRTVLRMVVGRGVGTAATGVAPQNYSAQLTANRLSPELAVATSRAAGVGFTGA